MGKKYREITDKYSGLKALWDCKCAVTASEYNKSYYFLIETAKSNNSDLVVSDPILIPAFLGSTQTTTATTTTTQLI